MGAGALPRMSHGHGHSSVAVVYRRERKRWRETTLVSRTAKMRWLLIDIVCILEKQLD